MYEASHYLWESRSDTESVPETLKKRQRKPSQHVQDLLAGKGYASDRPNAPKIPVGVQMPDANAVDDNDTADFWDEHVMAAEISDEEALEPCNLAEAKSRPDWLLWEKAIAEELATLKEAGTWELVDAPDGANIVGSKWVFRAKKDAGGNVVRYKARLVAQGFSQVPGVDYFDTFAPVARLSSIRAVLAIAAVRDYFTGQIDIKGAYLTSDEIIFMKQPPGYSIPSPSGKTFICHLCKTL